LSSFQTIVAKFGKCFSSREKKLAPSMDELGGGERREDVLGDGVDVGPGRVRIGHEPIVKRARQAPRLPEELVAEPGSGVTRLAS